MCVHSKPFEMTEKGRENECFCPAGSVTQRCRVVPMWVLEGVCAQRVSVWSKQWGNCGRWTDRVEMHSACRSNEKHQFLSVSTTGCPRLPTFTIGPHCLHCMAVGGRVLHL